MCGIFGYVGADREPASLILDGLKSLEYRGYDSWGVAVAGSHGIELKKKIGKIGAANVSELPSSTLGFGHTRWATHGGVSPENSHPHLDCTGTIAVVHNGIFENYAKIKRDLLKKGHQFYSQTDTEVIVHLIEEFSQKLPFDQAVRAAFLKMKGMNAIIAFRSGRQEMVAVRKGSPLVIGLGSHKNYLASDPAALLPHTKTVYFLDENEMVQVGPNKVLLSDLKTRKRLNLRPQQLAWKENQTLKGDYPYFLLKEINEQPQILATIAAAGASALTPILKLIKGAANLYLIGCGTASYAGFAGSLMLASVAQTKSNWCLGSEFGSQLQFVNKKTVILAFSQSGETMDLLESLKAAQTRGAKIVALVNVLGSSLYRLADQRLLMGAGPEKSVATSKDFTAKIGFTILLVYALAGKPQEGRQVLWDAVASTHKVLSKPMHEKIKNVAQKLGRAEHIFVLGRGISLPLSLEAALKIKEISYIHAEGLATGELKHGPLALIERGTPCLVFLPQDETYAANLNSAMEMKARGAMIIAVSQNPNPIFDFYIHVKGAGIATIIPNVVVAQLLAYYLTLERGLDPDMPRNLAKSVTVK